MRCGHLLGPTRAHEDCVESDIDTLKLFAHFTVQIFKGHELGTRPCIFPCSQAPGCWYDCPQTSLSANGAQQNHKQP
eukprot:1159344-Pelagomonas_calceolata.AAC.22